MKITREEYNKALKEFNNKFAGSDEKLSKIRKEINDIRQAAMNDGRIRDTRDLDGTYYNDADLYPSEQAKIDSLWDEYHEISDARFDEKEKLRKMLTQVKEYESAVRRVGREVPNADELSPEQIEEYQKVSKKIMSTKREIETLKNEIERITAENTEKITQAEAKLKTLSKQLSDIIALPGRVEENYTPHWWVKDLLGE